MEYLSALKDRPLLTFDDGDITNYTKALPILKEFGMRASFFIIGEWVGKNGYMDWSQIKNLQDNGMTIGAHGMTHRILTELNDDELSYELMESKRLLEEHLDCSIATLSIPRGFYNKRVMDKAKEIGYDTIFTSDDRIVIRSDWDLNRFMNIINNGPSFIDRTKKFIKNSARRTLGDKNYDKIRSGLLK
ncbi:MAG: polysaccharide deacetylase family protein [Candidatus Omnitrophota bacterium]|nr:polysaccharide deacetylase family protein [Candidatus Omnitrophota bacterium]